MLAWPEMEEFDIAKQEFEFAEEKGAYFRSRVEEWCDHGDGMRGEVNLDSWEDCQKFMFETD